MKRTLLFAACVAALCTASQPASAQGLIINSAGGGRNQTISIVPRAGGSIAQIIQLPQSMMTDERIAEDRKWADFCQPIIVANPPDYVRRYVYKHPGCEHGRSE